MGVSSKGVGRKNTGKRGESQGSPEGGVPQREGKSAASRADNGKGLLDKAVGREKLSIKLPFYGS